MKRLKHIGQSIRFVRLARDLTMEELAAEVGIASSYISMIEAGKRIPSWSMLQRMCEGLDVPLTLLAILLEKEDPFVSPILPLAFMELARDGTENENC